MSRKKPPHDHEHWTTEQVQDLKKLVRQNTPTRIIALKLGRTPESIYGKASGERISLKPTNQSPYNRRKK
jgi:hypothetical protein